MVRKIQISNLQKRARDCPLGRKRRLQERGSKPSLTISMLTHLTTYHGSGAASPALRAPMLQFCNVLTRLDETHQAHPRQGPAAANINTQFYTCILFESID